MIEPGEAPLYEYRQLLALNVWFLLCGGLSAALTFILTDATPITDGLWYLVVIMAVIRLVLDDIGMVYQGTFFEPNWITQLVRLGLVFGAYFVVVTIAQLVCGFGDTQAMFAQVKTLSAFKTGTLQCQCEHFVCFVGTALLSLVVAACKLRLQVIFVEITVSGLQIVRDFIMPRSD